MEHIREDEGDLFESALARHCQLQIRRDKCGLREREDVPRSTRTREERYLSSRPG